jgi:hypothetical protein
MYTTRTLTGVSSEDDPFLHQNNCGKDLANFLVGAGLWTLEKEYIFDTVEAGEDSYNLIARNLRWKDTNSLMRIRPLSTGASRCEYILDTTGDYDAGTTLKDANLIDLYCKFIYSDAMFYIALATASGFCYSTDDREKSFAYGPNGPIFEDGLKSPDISLDSPSWYTKPGNGKSYFIPAHVYKESDSKVFSILPNVYACGHFFGGLFKDQYGKWLGALNGPSYFVARE